MFLHLYIYKSYTSYITKKDTTLLDGNLGTGSFPYTCALQFDACANRLRDIQTAAWEINEYIMQITWARNKIYLSTKLWRNILIMKNYQLFKILCFNLLPKYLLFFIIGQNTTLICYIYQESLSLRPVIICIISQNHFS